MLKTSAIWNLNEIKNTIVKVSCFWTGQVEHFNWYLATRFMDVINWNFMRKKPQTNTRKQSLMIIIAVINFA